MSADELPSSSALPAGSDSYSPSISSRMARAWCSWIERLLGDASPMSGLAGGRPLNVPGSLECTPGYDHNEGLAPKAAQRYNFL